MKTNTRLLTLSLLIAVSAGFCAGNGVENEQPAEDMGHPSIYGNDGTKEGLKNKIDREAWAGEIYENIRAAVDPYVEQHATDPEWIVSRLQMHWKTHYTDTFVNGGVWSHGEGRAPVPTPRFAGGRDWNVDYSMPALEDVRPYDEDERGMWLQNRVKPDRPWEWAPVSGTGQIIERINVAIMELAEKAAFLYWVTGDESYARFASDIFWTYVQGMYYRKNPETYEDDRNAGIIGLATFEVIHEGITVPLAVSYDYLHDYLGEHGRDLSIVQEVFQRWADRIIEGGGSRGNWNINQARYIVYLGLSLEDDTTYPDGKGRQHYVAQFTTESSKKQKGLKDVVPEMYDPVSGVWPEAPGYAFSVTDTILQLSEVIHNSTGRDVLEDFPIIVPAATVVSQYLFPNGLTVGFGDAYHDVPYTQTMEILLTRFRRLGEDEAGNQVARILREQMKANGYRREDLQSLLALTSYVALPDPVDGGKPLQTRTFMADAVNFLVQRNAENEEEGMMLSLAGTRGGHMHANGMALELYGKGMVLAPDFGRGPSYWTQSHGEFYAVFAAHNTVVVDGVSDYSARKEQPFTLEAIEPKLESHEALSDNISFSDTSFVEPATDALQRRLVSLIRTSDSSGYFVDIFRSRRRDGNDTTHDYLYHNVGQGVDLLDSDGVALPLVESDALGSANGDHVGYDYFTDEIGAEWEEDLHAVFRAELEDERDVGMSMWMQGQDGRQIFAARSPVARSVGRGSVPTELQSLLVPTLIVRQRGPAWDKPFVAVFEPIHLDEGPTIKSIRRLEVSDATGDFVGIGVESRDGLNQFILNSTDNSEVKTSEGIGFSGTYGVVSEDGDGIVSVYLGKGQALMKDGYGIYGKGSEVSASLERVDGQWYCSSDKDVIVWVDRAQVSVPAGSRVQVEF